MQNTNTHCLVDMITTLIIADIADYCLAFVATTAALVAARAGAVVSTVDTFTNRLRHGGTHRRHGRTEIDATDEQLA